jgi:hypothetical protein
MANVYLNTPLPNYEYMRLRLDIILEEIVHPYNLRDIVEADTHPMQLKGTPG